MRGGGLVDYKCYFLLFVIVVFSQCVGSFAESASAQRLRVEQKKKSSLVKSGDILSRPIHRESVGRYSLVAEVISAALSQARPCHGSTRSTLTVRCGSCRLRCVLAPCVLGALRIQRGRELTLLRTHSTVTGVPCVCGERSRCVGQQRRSQQQRQRRRGNSVHAPVRDQRECATTISVGYGRLGPRLARRRQPSRGNDSSDELGLDFSSSCVSRSAERVRSSTDQPGNLPGSDAAAQYGHRGGSEGHHRHRLLYVDCRGSSCSDFGGVFFLHRYEPPAASERRTAGSHGRSRPRIPRSRARRSRATRRSTRSGTTATTTTVTRSR